MTCDPCDAGCVGSEAMPELIVAAYPHLADVVARIVSNLKPPPVPEKCKHCEGIFWAEWRNNHDAHQKPPFSGSPYCAEEHSCPVGPDVLAWYSIACPTCLEDHRAREIPESLEWWFDAPFECDAPAFRVAWNRICAMIGGRFTGDQRRALVRHGAIYEVVAPACPGRLHELVWTDGATVFRIAEDGTAADGNDAPVTPGPRESWRLAKLKGEDLPRWRAVFLDYGLIPPLRIWGDA